MFEHQDPLDALNHNVPLRDKLQTTHTVIREHFPFIERISIAIYDPQTELLKTYIDSSNTDQPIANYQAKLSDARSLCEILEQGRPRVVNDLELFGSGRQEHTQRIAAQGYGASLTMPMYYNGIFFGFVFFDSYEKNVFGEGNLHQLNLFGHMISLLVINELTALRTLVAAVKTASDMTHKRDFETGTHLDRMSRYARLIARRLAPTYDLDDDYIEHVFMFSPLHDIGKIGIPDSILLKPDSLTTDEFEVMKTHARKGREMIDVMLENFGLDTLQHIDILRNIAEFHHEAINGKGYPDGLPGDSIPLEARIVAVADVFDALTSHRPYKEAWSNNEAFAALQRAAGNKLDDECVQALLDSREEIEHIQTRFQEDPYG